MLIRLIYLLNWLPTWLKQSFVKLINSKSFELIKINIRPNMLENKLQMFMLHDSVTNTLTSTRRSPTALNVSMLKKTNKQSAFTHKT